MLDQNTDRMWYVIGAIVIGAAIIAMGLNIFSESFDSVDGMMASLTGVASENVYSIGNNGIYTDDEINNLIVNDGYIPVATASDLDNIRKSELQTFGVGSKWEGVYESGLDKKYVQVGIINLSEFDNWVPIGTFRGVYDGGGRLVINLSINQEGNYLGLFSRANGAIFRNIYLENVDIIGNNYIGGLVGDQIQTLIEGSYVTGSVSGVQTVGGLVGSHSRHSSVENSYTDVKVEGVKNVGGLIGHQIGILSDPLISSETHNSYAMGTVKGESYVGGLIGWNYYGLAINTAVRSSGWVVDNNIEGLRGIGAGYGRYDRNDLKSLTRQEAESIVQRIIK